MDIPTWDQERDPLPDGSLDPYRDTDCGEECAAMRIYYRTGRELSAGMLRLRLPGTRVDGRTTRDDIAFLLRSEGLRPSPIVLPAYTLAGNLQAKAAAGVPSIVLGSWVSPHILHWLLVVQAGVTGIAVNDPFGGRRYFLPWDLVMQRYAGECIL